MKAVSNLALIKYWGKEKTRQIPMNPSLSFLLNKCESSVEIDAIDFKDHEVIFEGITTKIKNHLSILDKYLNEVVGVKTSGLRVKCNNNFPSSAGIASSASGMAALTRSYFKFYQVDVPKDHLLNLARLGSGSAARSIFDYDFCTWEVRNTSPSNFEQELTATFSQKINSRIELDSLVVMFQSQAKHLSTTDGHKLMDLHPMRGQRIINVHKRFDECLKFLEEGNWENLIPLVEMETLEMHGLMLSSYPPLVYLKEESLNFLKEFMDWRLDKFCFFSIDAGANIHICFDPPLRKQIEEFVRTKNWIWGRLYK